MNQARSSFTVDDRDASPVIWEGGAMSRSRFAKMFTEDLVGSSVVEATPIMRLRAAQNFQMRSESFMGFSSHLIRRREAETTPGAGELPGQLMARG